MEELKRLDATPCDIPVLRRAAIFSCFTGLRVSDIMQLEWKHIVKAPDGGWCMRIRTEKTETAYQRKDSIILWKTQEGWKGV